MESFDRLHTSISRAGCELYVAITSRCWGGRGMIDPSVLSVTAVRVTNVKQSHVLLESSQWRIAVPLLHTVTYRCSFTAHTDISLFPYCTHWHIAVPLLHTLTYRCSLTARTDISLFPYCTHWHIAVPLLHTLTYRCSLTAVSNVSLFPYCTHWHIAVPLLHALTYRCSLTARTDISLFPYCTHWLIAVPLLQSVTYRCSLTSHTDVSPLAFRPVKTMTLRCHETSGCYYPETRCQVLEKGILTHTVAKTSTKPASRCYSELARLMCILFLHSLFTYFGFFSPNSFSRACLSLFLFWAFFF
jgi:hypothetical protein